MKVFIITEGGHHVGFGHLTRGISLYQAFEEQKITPEFIVNEDDFIKDLLKNKNYRTFNWLKGEKNLFEMLGTSDVVIIDTYTAEQSLYERTSKINCGRLVIIDDYNRLEYPKGIVINPSIYGERLSYPQKDNIVYLLGKDYVILRKEFWDIPEKKINKDIKNILVTFGVINHSDLAYKVINYLKEKFDFNFFLVEPKKKILDAKEILDLMLKADICISGGGQTTYELARVGVPTIGICLAKNQMLNLEGWQNVKFIEYIGWYNDGALLEKIENSINKLMPYKERIRRNKIGKSHIRGKGARKIVSVLIKKYDLSEDHK